MRASETASTSTSGVSRVSDAGDAAAVPVVTQGGPKPAPSFRPRAMQRARGTPTWLVFDVPDPRLAALGRAVGRAIRARPLAAISLAAGLGFLVGGVLSFRVGRVVLSAGGRHVASELLKQLF